MTLKDQRDRIICTNGGILQSPTSRQPIHASLIKIHPFMSFINEIGRENDNESQSKE